MIFNVSGGGGTALNFRIVGNPKPSTAKENTIWIDTDVPITSYIFSATQPTGVPGMVWITTGTSSTVAFNALKKNGIQVYPISAKQYVNGVWETKGVYIYRNGTWDQSLNRYYMYNRGDNANGGGFGASYAPNVQYNADHIWLKGAEDPPVFIHTAKKIPLGYKKLVIVGEVVSSLNNVCFQSSGMASSSNWGVVAMWDHGAIGHFTKTIDISSIDIAEYGYVKIAVGHSSQCIGKIYEIYVTM